MSMAKVGAALLVAGWLAQQLARPDRDVERGIAAYEARAFEEALAAFDAAVERRGERPELSFDRGLVLLAQDDREGAKTAFERASEADDARVRASAHYQLGNLAFDASEWDAAVTHYIECLKALPDHGNAKWNLELALERKRAEEEKQKEEEQQKQDQQDQDQQDQDQQDRDQQDQDQQDQDQQDGDPQDQDSEQEEKPDEPKPEEADDSKPEQPPEGEDEKKDEPEPQDDAQERQAEPQAIDQMDIDKALEQLDEQDAFMLDRPRGGYAPPEKDW